MTTANSSVVLSQLDFNSHKESLKQFLKSQERFKDYNFDSSNMSVMLDVLAYNTYQNSFYLNMVANEMFLDSAKLRDSVISHAKELNYLPRSFISSTAKVNIQVTSSDVTKRSITIPKGTAFISRVGDDSFTFTTDENIVVSSTNNVFTANDVELYEGSFLNETYLVNYEDPIKYAINNKQVDISSVEVSVIEDNGSNRIEYQRATSLFDLDETSEVFFIQPTVGDRYEVVFGDGVVGRRPKDNSVIIIEYRVCAGELPNGARKFVISGRIDNEQNVTVSVVDPANGGAVAETINSIKFNAPRAFTTQERAVTAEDYENLLKANYPEINAVSAFGGENASPPQYGKVFVSVDLDDVDGLPLIKREEYAKFLRSRSTVSMEPIFVSPEYTYLNVVSNIKYNINLTGLNPEDIRTIAISSILSFAGTSLNNFNRALRYSRLIKSIDDADSSIVSNETDIDLIKYIIPQVNVIQNINLHFKTPLLTIGSTLPDEYPFNDLNVIGSTTFTYQGQNNCSVEDDNAGNLNIVLPVGSNYRKITRIGSVNYETGEININNFAISDYQGSVLKIYAKPRNRDLISNQNVILNILEPDISLIVEQIRE